MLIDNINISDNYKKDGLIYYNFDQGSSDWIQHRFNYITASSIYTVIGNINNKAYKNLIAEKASNGVFKINITSNSTKWGHRYEPVANMIYSHQNDLIVYDCGFVNNPQYPLLGASPDGIINSDLLIEIKCPISRTIDGNIKPEYYHQMQQQLLVCDAKYCDFVECKFTEIDSNIFWNIFSNNNKYKGIIVHCMIDSDKKNYYSPIALSNDKINLKEWLDFTQSTIINSGGNIDHLTYWINNTYNCQRVNRDIQWHDKIKSKIDVFWNTVSQYKNEGLADLCSTLSSKNKIMNGICLI